MDNCSKGRYYHRILMLLGIIFLICSLFLVRLIVIQLVHYGQYSRLAAAQRQSPLLVNTMRGSFWDRHGKVIRGEANAWYLLIEKVNSQREKQITRELKTILTGDFMAQYLKNWARHTGKPFWIYPRPLNKAQIAQINALNFPECKIVAHFLRQDTFQGNAWHILGLTNNDRGYSGLEYLYQSLLNGQENPESIFTLSDGEQRMFPGLGLRTLTSDNPVGIILTIDQRFQRIVESVMDNHNIAGAIVILDARSGEILAMASRPMADFSNLQNNAADYPFINRAIAAYQPGSIFKLIIASAGLDSGWVGREETFAVDEHQSGFPKKVVFDSNHELNRISLKDAFAYSYNPVFIETTLRMGPQLILDYADKFGLGQPCNIGLLDESWGELPSGIGLSEGEIANMAIGQQLIYTTPLQIASLVQTIANDGVRCIPRLVLGSIRQKGKLSLLEKPPRVRVIQRDTAQVVKDLMAAVVAFGTGTAAGLDLGVAGKTGTAQVGDKQESAPHAWFAGFTPIVDPKYVTVVFCEHGISGAETAAPLFKEVMEKVTRIGD